MVLLALAGLVLTGCTATAGEGLLDLSFRGDQPISEYLIIDVGKEIEFVEFIISARFRQGSTSAYIYEPDGTPHVLGLGLTGATQTLKFNHPLAGKWKLEVHVDGNANQIVDGDLRLALQTNLNIR